MSFTHQQELVIEPATAELIQESSSARLRSQRHSSGFTAIKKLMHDNSSKVCTHCAKVTTVAEASNCGDEACPYGRK